MKRDPTENRASTPTAGGDSGLEREDVELVARISQAYRAPQLSRAERVRLDAELWDRSERRRRWFAVAYPGIAAAAIASLIVWFMLPSAIVHIDPDSELAEVRIATVAEPSQAPQVLQAAPPPPPQQAPQASPSPAAVAAVAPEDLVVVGAVGARGADAGQAWEYDILFATDPVDDAPDDHAENLPADYQAIDDMFLAG